jgi:hypothetical protein
MDGMETLPGNITPQWLFDVLDEQVRALTGKGFQLDVAAWEGNAKCRLSFAERTHALRQDWSKWPTISCNPPFRADLLSQFATKALDAATKGSTVVFILPWWPGHSWFQDLKRRGRVQDILGPVAFERSDGGKFVLNKGNGISLVAVTLGPRVVPGSNGEPITKGQLHGWSSSARALYQAQVPDGLTRPCSDPSVLTSYRSDNDHLLAEVARLFFRPGDRIADGTYGMGRFWRKLDLSQYEFHPSDLLTVPEHPYDFRHLPYRCGSFNVPVYDPPYIHQRRGQARQRIHGADYKNAKTTRGFSDGPIIQLFREGMAEGHRLLKPGGLMLVKCQDQIDEGGRQRMAHLEVHDIALKELGMEVEELFILTQTSPLLQFGRSPRHARKSHSTLWVFRKK